MNQEIKLNFLICLIEIIVHQIQISNPGFGFKKVNFKFYAQSIEISS